MNIKIDLANAYRRQASIAFEEDFSTRLPERERTRLEADLEALLKVFGGLMVALVEDRTASTKTSDRPDREEFIDDLMSTLERFAVRRVQGPVQGA